MKTPYYTCVLLAAGQLVVSASGQTWTVREYGGAPCGCFTTDSVFKTIRITSNPSRTLKFEVHDGSFTPEEINDFTIDGGIFGSLDIQITGDHNLGRLYGASSIAKMNLKRADILGRQADLVFDAVPSAADFAAAYDGNALASLDAGVQIDRSSLACHCNRLLRPAGRS